MYWGQLKSGGATDASTIKGIKYPKVQSAAGSIIIKVISPCPVWSPIVNSMDPFPRLLVVTRSLEEIAWTCRLFPAGLKKNSLNWTVKVSPV